MRKLEGLRWEKRWVGQMGCARPSLAYQGLEVSFPWLYGATGHAFVINVAAEQDPSGPTCWNWQRLFRLTPNAGFRVEGFSVERQEAGDQFPARQREAWDFVRGCIDRGVPCFGWELHPCIPDHYLIYGYDDTGYLYSGWDEGHMPWDQLGTHDVQVLQVYAMERCALPPDEQVVREALATAVELAEWPDSYDVAPGFASGLEAYEVWAKALESGKSSRDGHSYNAEVWHECRAMAAAFLEEVTHRLPGWGGPALAAAGERYRAARDKLAAVVAMHPSREQWDDTLTLTSPEAAALLREAGVAEREAVAALRAVVDGR